MGKREQYTKYIPACMYCVVKMQHNSEHAQLKQNAMIIYTGYRKVCVVMINGPSNQVRKRGIATCTVEVRKTNTGRTCRESTADCDGR